MTTPLLRNSERQTFKKCRHRWQWTYRDGREAREAAHALRFGDLVHRALEPYYKPGKKRGPHPAKTFTKLYIADAKALADDGFDVWSDEKWVNARSLGERMLEGYVEHFAPEQRKLEVIHSELTFKYTVRDAGGQLVRVVGTFDGLWRDHDKDGRPFFVDFKTATSIKQDGLALDEQAGTYWTYGPAVLRRRGLIGPDEDIANITYIFLRKAAPNADDVYNEHGQKLNQDGSVSKRQPAPYFARIPVYRSEPDRRRMDGRVREEARDIRRARAGKLALYKNPGPLHMPNCMGCPVKEACEVHEAGGDFQSVLDATTRPWNPYAAHELPERV